MEKIIVKYSGERCVRRENSYVEKEVGTVDISIQHNDIVFTSEGKMIYGNNEVIEPSKISRCHIVIDEKEDPESKQKCHIHRGKLIQEGQSDGLFDGVHYNASTYEIIGDQMIRRVCMDYSFKGPFGGYWFCSQKDIHHWNRIKRFIY
jgi:hypothetical protein